MQTHARNHTHTHCTNTGATRFSGFIAISSPALIKKLPQPRTSCWGNKEVIMFFKWSPITANFTVCLEAVCCSDSNWTDSNCSARQKADAFYSSGAEDSQPVCLSSPAHRRSLCSSSSFISREWGETVNSIPSLSPSLVDVLQCAQLLCLSISFGQKDLGG